MKEKSSEILFEEIQSRTNKNTINFFKVVVAIVSTALVVKLVLHRGRTTDFGYFLMIILPVLLLSTLFCRQALSPKSEQMGSMFAFVRSGFHFKNFTGLIFLRFTKENTRL